MMLKCWKRHSLIKKYSRLCSWEYNNLIFAMRMEENDKVDYHIKEYARCSRALKRLHEL